MPKDINFGLIFEEICVTKILNFNSCNQNQNKVKIVGSKVSGELADATFHDTSIVRSSVLTLRIYLQIRVASNGILLMHSVSLI